MSRAEERLWERARNYLVQGQTIAARVALESLIVRQPEHTQAHLTLGGIAWKEGRVRHATEHALAAARALPAEPNLICDVVAALGQVGEIVTARSLIDHPALAQSTAVPILMRLSGQCQMWGEHERSLALLDRAKAAGAGGSDFHCFRGIQLSFNGRLPEAESELDACLSLNAGNGRAALALARLRRQTSECNHLARLTRAIANTPHGSEDHAALEFALYKESEDLGRYEDAWGALVRANALMQARQDYDAGRELRCLQRLVETCTPQFLNRAEITGSGPMPIFIVGMPRSGTTVLERMLGSHSSVTSAGELGDFVRQLRWGADLCSTLMLDERLLERLPDLDYAQIGRRYLAQTQWRAHDRPFYVDKLPLNWQLAGLIHRALPQAPILHLVRDPMDVCFSNFRALFGDSYPYSYQLGTLAAYYRLYRRVMAHWQTSLPGRILDVAYDDLVREPDAVGRRVLAFCGLRYEPGCAELNRNSATVATLSMAQVREPIHQRAFGEWRRYEAQLCALRDAIVRA